MALSVNIALLSGQQAAIDVSPDASIDDLRNSAEEELGQALSQLVASSGQVLSRALAIFCLSVRIVLVWVPCYFFKTREIET